ncbi:hypothetical protein PYW08_004896 [Mythimna loreyi]|uniref:Uncharacterized protein n=1 Tax=Mythimna loreyi TaxID=667449 RepID=A0ACC2QDL6_9NEOP|nr:hypothetical protein PYW08_004896 [Mythimna loreyi]
MTRATVPGVPAVLPGVAGVLPGVAGVLPSVPGVARQSSTSSTSSRERPPSPPRRADPPPVKSPPIKSPPPVASPLVKSPPVRGPTSHSANVSSPPVKKVIPPRADVTSPPAPENKPAPLILKSDDVSSAPRTAWRESPVAKEGPVKVEKLSLASTEIERTVESGEVAKVEDEKVENEAEKDSEKAAKSEESNGVGDKIKKFEKAAEDACGTMGRLSRPGSVRGRARSERLGSDNSREDLPPPATPFKDNVHFELSAAPSERAASVLERQQSLTRAAAPRWQRPEPDGEKRPEPQKIIKPEFKPMPSPVDVTIRSPSLGAKIADQFPSHGTAFRNVASPDPSRSRDPHKVNDDVNTQNNFKTCKFKTKDKYSVSKGSSYFTRGSEEIWLVKKKDIEEIEERVLDSFRRAGGNVCVRSESVRPASDSGAPHGPGRKRAAYARSESLDPQWAGARAHTLKRQSSVACTCGHDKKTRAKSAADAPRPRSRSHGDDAAQAHVLDKYETLV